MQARVRTTGRRIAVGVVGPLLVAVAIAEQEACILAQSSGEIPSLPASRPTIVHPSVVPSTSAVLRRFPTRVIVPVELVDPTLPFVYAAFIDYDPLTGAGRVVDPTISAYELRNSSDRIRRLEIDLPEPDLGACHVVEVVVALRFKATIDGKTAHTPDEPGGDLVTWFYSPTGDFDACSTVDAGIGAFPVDAAGDVGAE